MSDKAQAKRAAIADLNKKLRPHGWFSEDFKAGFDFGFDAAWAVRAAALVPTQEDK